MKNVATRRANIRTANSTCYFLYSWTSVTNTFPSFPRHLSIDPSLYNSYYSLKHCPSYQVLAIASWGVMFLLHSDIQYTIIIYYQGKRRYAHRRNILDVLLPFVGSLLIDGKKIIKNDQARYFQYYPSPSQGLMNTYQRSYIDNTQRVVNIQKLIKFVCGTCRQ